MREDIGLFRGKRLDNGEWVEGHVYHDVDGWFILACADFEKGEKWSGFPFLVAVDPATVGEYTGLKDKNGKRVFEGDIVVYDNTPYNAYGHRVIGAIVWRKWAWKLKYTEYGSVFHYAIGSEDFFHAKSEVIGSIHDNPELLEV